MQELQRANRQCLPLQILQKCADIQEHISEGSIAFLTTEYKYMGVFMVRCLQPPSSDVCTNAVVFTSARSPASALPRLLPRMPPLT